MRSTSNKYAMSSAAMCFLAAFFAMSLWTWEQDPMRDGLTDDLITPWCRIGSLESWEGRPCVVPMRGASDEATADLR
jgi:hypothetical protein